MIRIRFATKPFRYAVRLNFIVATWNYSPTYVPHGFWVINGLFVHPPTDRLGRLLWIGGDKDHHQIIDLCNSSCCSTSDLLRFLYKLRPLAAFMALLELGLYARMKLVPAAYEPKKLREFIESGGWAQCRREHHVLDSGVRAHVGYYS